MTVHGLRTVMLGALLVLGTAACSDTPDAAQTPAGRASEAASAAPLAAARVSPGAVRAAGADVRPAVAGTVVTGLRAPWGLAFLPNGSALVSERDTADVKLIASDGTVSTVGTVPGVHHGGEGGLLGIAVGPDFSTDPQLYAYRTTDSGNEIIRMAYSDTGLGDPTVLVRGIESGVIHDGGRLAFGPDGMLYAGTGETGRRTPAQDPASLNGKILRMTPAGRPAPGNPDPNSLVWSTGHRNVQGLAWDDAGRLWASEFGQDTWDELNLVARGDNDGWPVAEGIAHDARFVDPQREWHTDEASPSGIAVWNGSIWMAALRGARLWQIPLTGDPSRPTADPRPWLAGEYGRLRTVMAAPDGSLWLMTNNTDTRGTPQPGDDRILRLTLS